MKESETIFRQRHAEQAAANEPAPAAGAANSQYWISVKVKWK
jgi:hypothetical protein